MAGTPLPARPGVASATPTRTVVVAGLVVAGSVLLAALALSRVLGRAADLPTAGGLTVLAAVAGLVAGLGGVVVPAHRSRHTLGELATRALAAGLAATLVVGAAPVLVSALLAPRGVTPAPPRSPAPRSPGPTD